MDGSERRKEVGIRSAPPPDRSVAAREAAPVFACWSCFGPLQRATVFCGTCAAVQPPGQVDHFSRLGLEIGYDLNACELDRVYFQWQRQLHPDRFATRTPRERAFSQSQATSLNEAYETLKDPLRRGEYLLHLRRDGATPEGCNLVNDLDLLNEAMELREMLAEAGSVEEVRALAARAADDIRACTAELSNAFATDDIDTASRLTTRLKYLRKLADDCRTRRLQLSA